MGTLDRRVVIVTGAGRGLGREHALLLAAEGATVVVNDLGVSSRGDAESSSPADEVVAEIEAAGGRAAASFDDISTWAGAEHLISSTVERFGALHALVNNAGILRDRVLALQTEAEWDVVVDVDLKGHFCPMRFAAAYWRDQHKAGRTLHGRIVNTSSPAGLFGNSAQANYAAAKAGILALTTTAALELERYDVRVNCIAPAARTRLTTETTTTSSKMAAPDDPEIFDEYHPANVSPVVAMLASEQCRFNGQVFLVRGRKVGLCDTWRLSHIAAGPDRWTVDGLREATEGFPAQP